jgi:hypothetical protein
VDVVVSLGWPVVPDVVGMTEINAIGAIAVVGLVASVSEAYSATVAAGLVISQNPDAGQSLPPTGTVNISVSLGARTTPPSGDIGIAADIADAVAAEINAATAGTFSFPFTAARHVLPKTDLTELKTITVTVVPKSVEIATQTRTMCLRDVMVDIGIQKKIAKEPGLDTDVASIGVLADEITTYLRKRTLTNATYAVWVRITNDPVYSVEHLDEHRVYTSVLTVTYRMMT